VATNDEFGHMWRAILGRVGYTPRDRLAWVVREVQKKRHDMTPADRDNLRSELAVFVMAGVGGAVGDRHGNLFRPELDEVKSILDELYAMIASAVRRERVNVGPTLVRNRLVWDTETCRYTTIPMGPYGAGEGWSSRGRRMLARLIEENGHFLRECPAPEARDPAAQCGSWFVANRPRQLYCSPRCQSRAATQAYRKKQTTKPRRKR
jgi:hypothetical protein